MFETKNTLDGFNSRLDNAEEKINELEDTAIETFQNETQREKIKQYKKMKNALVSCGRTTNRLIYTQLKFMEVGTEKIFKEIMARFFPNLLKPTDPRSSANPKHKKTSKQNKKLY